MRLLLLLLVMVAGGCASLPSGPQHSDTQNLVSAAAAAPRGVPGEFTVQIKSSGLRRASLYLSTQANQQSETAVTLVLDKDVVSALSDRYGQPAQSYLINKTVTVRGIAKRRKVAVIKDGRPSSQFYWQTQIRVATVSQLDIHE